MADSLIIDKTMFRELVARHTVTLPDDGPPPTSVVLDDGVTHDAMLSAIEDVALEQSEPADVPKASPHDRIIAALLALGAVDSGKKAAKYTCLRLDVAFKRDEVTNQIITAPRRAERLFWVGRGGVLRHGASVTKSVPVHDAARRWLLERGT